MVITKFTQQFPHKTCAAAHIENDTASRWQQSLERLYRGMGGPVSKLIQKVTVVGFCPITVGEAYLIAVLLGIVSGQTGIQAG